MVLQRNPTVSAHRFLVLQRKSTNVPLSDFVAVFCFKPSQFSGWQTEDSCRLLTLRPTISSFPFYCLHQPSPCPQPLSVLSCEAPVILDTDAGLDVHAEGPTTRNWIPTFRAEGRISFSKCLAGKYVTRLKTDPVKNRWDVFKLAAGACAICFSPHTHLKIESVPCQQRDCLSRVSSPGAVWNLLLNLL